MINFYNSRSHIFLSSYFENTFLSESQARIFKFDDFAHLTSGNGFFSPLNSYQELVDNLKKKKILTAYFSLHPLANLDKSYDNLFNFTNKNIFVANLKNDISINSFSKSVKQKILKNLDTEIEICDTKEFSEKYSTQTFFNKQKKLNLNYENIKIYKIIKNQDISFAAFGFLGEVVDYLLAFSSSNGRYLQSVLIYHFINNFKNSFSYLNLGGGIKAFDGVENFKSLFNFQVHKMRVLKIITDDQKYKILNKNNNSTNFFFPSFLNKKMIDKINL